MFPARSLIGESVNEREIDFPSFLIRSVSRCKIRFPSFIFARSLSNRCSSSLEMKKEEGLPYLRDNLFISILILGFPICFLVYIPSIVVSLITHQFIIGIFDTIAILVFLFIFLYKNQSMKAKKILFSAIFYILSIILLIYLGIKGPSIIILLCISVLITLFQSKRAGLIAVALNAVIFLLFMAVLPIQSISLSFFKEYTTETWIGVGLNLIAFNCLVVL